MATSRHKRLKQLARNYLLLAGDDELSSSEKIDQPHHETPYQPTKICPNYGDFKDEHVGMVALIKMQKNTNPSKY
jgi:hypothetical protein